MKNQSLCVLLALSCVVLCNRSARKLLQKKNYYQYLSIYRTTATTNFGGLLSCVRRWMMTLCERTLRSRRRRRDTRSLPRVSNSAIAKP